MNENGYLGTAMLLDFDMRFWHTRSQQGGARCLEQDGQNGVEIFNGHAGIAARRRSAQNGFSVEANEDNFVRALVITRAVIVMNSQNFESSPSKRPVSTAGKHSWWEDLGDQEKTNGFVQSLVQIKLSGDHVNFSHDILPDGAR